ncbi:hydroxyethylthiazole kinase [Prolixibacter bellariivorans]|uniref:Hydroxyethylthiazole kinase n=1 Tax=Prolixibacter bellariivorans TaxID=314319 RepID=A0A5M4B5W2_9BACT|nr:hydroxyethylthiazole kinase [Prolixibacter bellariivorans]GET35213.1 hydroxyethylthiazole kinase [Prolixibacter bellariivorans]
MIDAKSISTDLKAVREQSPLVHNITNYVVMNNTANALLAVGASPVMAHAPEEVADMIQIASALVINMGTLSRHWVDAMLLAGKAARGKGIPVVFDPVGVGATPYRNEVAAQILEQCRPDIIRGNGSEIMALANTKTRTKGVDSIMTSRSALDSAKELASQNGAVVVISGPEDLITDGTHVHTIKNGSLLMPKVTGMGCTATALTGAFAAVNSDALKAAAHAMAVMGIAGELATKKSSGPGSLQLQFIDMLYQLSEADIAQIFLP